MAKQNWMMLGVLMVLGAAALWYVLRPRPGTFALQPLRQPAGPIQLDNTYAGDPNITFVGGQNCKSCHEVEYKDWLGSDHDRAMDVANAQTVLGDFNDATLVHYGVRSRFYRKDGKYYVHTEGAGGKFSDYRVLYVFGFDPLQQYIVETEPGRLQMLPLAWGADPLNPKDKPHWYHLYPDERIKPDDQLFWTGPNQNYNFMCAECHSTNLKKKYQPATKNYGTTFSEIDVSCEACHGPGSEHIKWARANAAGHAYPTHTAGPDGLVLSLKNAEGSSWVFDPTTNAYKRTKPLANRVVLQTCGRCHSRRSVVTEDYVYGKSLHDTHRVELLNEHLYHADGQIEDEVYVFGSFVQSKMYHKGVRCMDCHNPHSLQLLRPGNQLCTHCHVADYDSPKHYFDHKPGTPGSRCVDCHMAQRYYMVTDPRRDHSFRIPRPDLSVKLGTPNTCNDCHHKPDQTPQWALNWVNKWYGPKRQGPLPPHYAEAIAAGRRLQPRGAELLKALVDNPGRPAIVRATAIQLLRNYTSARMFQSVLASLDDADPMVRLSALGALMDWPPQRRWQVAAKLLDDPVRAVRVEAARVLAAGSRQLAQGGLAVQFSRALAAFRKTQHDNADRASAHVNLAVMHVDLGELDQAETDYRMAIDLEPQFIPAYVNLADLYRLRHQDDKAEQVARAGLKIAPRTAVLHHVLGLVLVRQRNTEQGVDERKTAEAISQLKQAVTLAPQNVQFSYVYAVALNSTGKPDEAMAVLKKILEHAPNDQQTLLTCALFCRDQGRIEKARDYARRLLAIDPNNPDYQHLVKSLQSAGSP